MTQEDKELLLKDICSRLPYNVICKVEFRESGEYKSKNMFLSGIFTDEAYFTTEDGSIYSNKYKPFLRPLSSMTEEQSKELEEIDPEFYSVICENGDRYVNMDVRGYDWLNKNHFDYRGLIEKSLALDATNLGIYE